VFSAARVWAGAERRRRPELVRLGVFGSYARGEAGVGSDLDLVAVVRQATEPFARRAAAWDITSLPVPAEILVYTEGEWEAVQARGGRFAEMLATTTV
jgi:predicted nucleotidyltransferase